MNNITLNILQWNAQSIMPKKVEFEQLLNEEKVHIALLSETWLDSETAFTIKDYNVYRQDRDDGYGGVAIIAHSSIKAQQVSTITPNSGIQLVHVRVFNCKNLENIMAVYCPSSVRTTFCDWNSLFSLVTNKTLIAGDFNGHHTNWSIKTDSRGTQLLDAMLDNNYVTLNDGTHTRVKLVNGRVQRTSPDICFSSSDVAINFDWTVISESLGSDHLAIKITTSYNAPSVSRRRRNFKKADWEGYRKYIHANISLSQLAHNDQEAYDQFVESIEEAASKFIPDIIICEDPKKLEKFRPKPYWNQTLSQVVAERRLALTEFRNNPTPSNLEVLQAKISKAQRLIREAKNETWRQFCTSIDSKVTTHEMWKRMKWLKGRHTPKIHINEEQTGILLHSLTPDSVSLDKPSFNSVNEVLSSKITLHELNNTLKNKDTTPGSDNISYSMIKNLPDSAKHILISLFNRFLLNGFVPFQWRDTKILPIPKSGSETGTIKLRPIALISCVCKTLHSILTKRLEWYLEKNKHLSNNTIGFRRAKSSLENLSTLISTVQLGFCKGQSTLSCFVDIENAYNNVDIYSLLYTLNDLGVGSMICSYLWEFLRLRNISILPSNEKSDVRSTCRGLAQGDPMSPILFNVATIRICKIITNVGITQYADDFAIYVTSGCLTDAVSQLQSALNTFNTLIEQLGLKISTSKTKICLFRKGYKTYDINIKINDNSIHTVESLKYLGIWLDKSLRWGKHTNETHNKVIKFINIFKVLAGSSWGIHPKYLRQLYISIVRSRLDYGSFLYANFANTHKSKLEKVQNQLMRVIGGFIKSTPIHV